MAKLLILNGCRSDTAIGLVDPLIVCALTGSSDTEISQLLAQLGVRSALGM